MDHLPRHPQVAVAQVVRFAVPRHPCFQTVAAFQQQEPALRARDGQSRIHHGDQHVVYRERTL